jgi:hypothetical protein
MERPLFIYKLSSVLTRFDFFSKDDAKGLKRPLPGHCDAFLPHFPPQNPLCVKIPRMVREKNTPFPLKIIR